MHLGIIRAIGRAREYQVIIIATIVLLGVVLAWNGGRMLEDAIQGVAASLGPEHESELTAVAVDRDSLVELGPWPWPNATISNILNQIELSNAKLVVLDPAIARDVGSAARPFMNRGGKRWLVTGYDFYATLSDLPAGYDDERARAERDLTRFALPASPKDDSTLVAVAGVDADTLRGGVSGAAEGFANIFPDSDGVVRSQPLAVRLGHRAYPSLALAAAARLIGFTPLISEGPSGRPDGIALGEHSLSTRSDAALAIDYSNCPGKSATISAADVARGEADAEAISGRIVVLGITEPDLAPMAKTPLGMMPTVEIQACTLNMIASDDEFYSFAKSPWTYLAIIIASLIFIALAPMNLRNRTLWAIGIAIASLVAAVVLCRAGNVLLPAMHFAIAMILFLASARIWHFITIEMPMRRRMLSFRMRIAPHLLRKASASRGSFDPEGRGCEIAAYAIDIRGFGPIARGLDAGGLCSFLREYRNMVSKPLLAGGAFIDSWSGDECRAAFGTPLPDQTRAVEACRAAVMTLHAFSAARERLLKSFGVEKLRLGIGIWMGGGATGELGPQGADNFGVTGGAMEAAATLRALNRNYRTSVLVGNEVKLVAERSFRFRPLDPIEIHGADKPVVIHELVGEIGVIMPQLPTYLAARSAYLKGDFERAVHLFGELLREHPHDGPSHLFLRRAKTLLKSPPKAEWLGVWSP